MKQQEATLHQQSSRPRGRQSSRWGERIMQNERDSYID